MRRDFLGINNKPFRERFEMQYTPEPMSGCWLWLGSESGGYGEIGNDRKRFKAHRASLILHGINPDGKVVMHKCDNRLCVNPQHLALGTYLDNSRDCVAKRRITHGERCHTAKLTEEMVLAIRNSKLSNSRLGRIYGVRSNTISSLRLGKSWTHVGGPIGTIPDRGSRRGSSKLNEKWVAEILVSKERPSELAKRYKVCDQTIHNIKKRKLWRHVEPPKVKQAALFGDVKGADL